MPFSSEFSLDAEDAVLIRIFTSSQLRHNFVFENTNIVHSRKNGQLPLFGALWLMTSLRMCKHGLKGFQMRRV